MFDVHALCGLTDSVTAFSLVRFPTGRNDTRALIIGVILLLAVGNRAEAQTTIVARETGSWLVNETGMEPVQPQWEITYVVHGNAITRTKLVDIRDGSVRTDNTVYQILNLPFHDVSALIFNSVSEQFATYAGPLIRALGQPAPAAIEILVFGPTFVRSVRSSGGYFAVTDLERSQ